MRFGRFRKTFCVSFPFPVCLDRHFHPKRVRGQNVFTTGNEKRTTDKSSSEKRFALTKRFVTHASTRRCFRQRVAAGERIGPPKRFGCSFDASADSVPVAVRRIGNLDSAFEFKNLNHSPHAAAVAKL